MQELMENWDTMFEADIIGSGAVAKLLNQWKTHVKLRRNKRS